jgi:hypothetical protein
MEETLLVKVVKVVLRLLEVMEVRLGRELLREDLMVRSDKEVKEDYGKLLPVEAVAVATTVAAAAETTDVVPVLTAAVAALVDQASFLLEETVHKDQIRETELLRLHMLRDLLM